MHTGRAAGRRIPEARRVQGPTAVALTCGLAWFLTGNAGTARPRPTTAESESISVVTPEGADEIQSGLQQRNSCVTSGKSLVRAWKPTAPTRSTKSTSARFRDLSP